MRYLITGAGGFAGHHFLEHALRTTDAEVVATDSFEHKGKMSRITDVLNGPWSWLSRVSVITHNLVAPFSRQELLRMGDIDYIVAYASESHVDRSIDDPVPFVRNNVDIALQTMELARILKPRAVAWVSTDEVYGPVTDRNVKGLAEWAPILPSNPYSASKAAQEAICTSYWRTYGVPVVLFNCMNMIGERQDAEKFVPLVIQKVLAGEQVDIHLAGDLHGDLTGTRHYLHARNLADAIIHVFNSDIGMYPFHKKAGTYPGTYTGTQRPDRYNIATDTRLSNLAMATLVAQYAGCELNYRLVDAHSVRPGHDAHYGLNASKIAKLGWTPPVLFEESLEKTVHWTLDHPEWLLD